MKPRMDPKQAVSLGRSVDSSLSSGGSSPSHTRHSRNRLLFGKRKGGKCGIDKESTPLSPVGLDVTCGRGKHRWNSRGNRRYRVIIMENIIRYQEARTKTAKSRIVREVVEQVQENKAKFLKKDQTTNLWKELTPTETRTKVAHALRDHIRNFCSSMSASNPNPLESESIEGTTPNDEEDERESHHGKRLSPLPNPMNTNNGTTENLSGSAHEVSSWAALPSNSSVVLRASALDVSRCAHKEQRKQEPVAANMAPPWQPVRISCKHLEDDQEFSVGGSYLDLPLNGHHQQPFQSRPCDKPQQQDHRKNDGMSDVTQLSDITLTNAISSCVFCKLHSGGEYDPNTGDGNFQVGNNQNVRSFGVCSCRNIPDAITMAMSLEHKESTFLQHEPDTFVPQLFKTNGLACGERSLAIGSRPQANNDAIPVFRSVRPPMPMEGYSVGEQKMALCNNFSASQLIGGSPMVGSPNVSRATGAFDSVDQGHFTWLNYHVNETNTPSFGGQTVNDKHNYTFQSRFTGTGVPTINHNLGSQPHPPLPLGFLNSVSSFPGLCDDDANDMDDPFDCGKRVG